MHEHMFYRGVFKLSQISILPLLQKVVVSVQNHHEVVEYG